MKKFMSIFLAMILLVSIPVFAAGNGNQGSTQASTSGSGSGKTVSGNNMEKSDVQGNRPAEELGTVGMKNEVKIQEKVKSKVMTMTKEMKKEFNTLKEQAKKCVSNNNSTCVQVRNQLKSKAKENLIWSAQKAEDILEKAKTKISSLKLTEEEKTALENKITEKMNSLAEERKSLEEDVSEVTSDTIKNSVAAMRHAWNEVKKETNMNMHKHALQKFEGIFEKMSQTPEALKKQLEKLNEKGDEIDDSLTATFFEKKAEAEKAYQEAKEYLEKAEQSSDEEASELMKSSREKMKETQQLLIQAREELKKAVQEMKTFKKAESVKNKGDNK